MFRSVNDAAADAIRVVREHDAAKPDDTEYEEIPVMELGCGSIRKDDGPWHNVRRGIARFPRKPKRCEHCGGNGVKP